MVELTLSPPAQADSTTTLRILTNAPEPRASVNWQRRTDFCEEVRGGRGLWSDLVAAWSLFRLSCRYDAIVVATLRGANLFIMLAACMPRRFPPIIVAPCLWELPRSGWRRPLKILQYRWMCRATSCLVVWCRHEVIDFANAIGVSPSKFVQIDHHHTLESYEYDVHDGGYIFAGGDGHRDYPALLRAVEGLGLPLKIATRRSDWNQGHPIPESVEVQPATHAKFRQMMAGARLVVVPLEGGHLHIGGEQTYLNAMAMGKPVIVTDTIGAVDYIDHGVNGLLVPAGDWQKLRAAIQSIIDDDTFARQLGSRASEALITHGTPVCKNKILQLVENIVAKGRQNGTH